MFGTSLTDGLLGVPIRNAPIEVGICVWKPMGSYVVWNAEFVELAALGYAFLSEHFSGIVLQASW